MPIKGVEGLTIGEMQDQVRQGAKFVVFGYCMSFLEISLEVMQAFGDSGPSQQGLPPVQVR